MSSEQVHMDEDSAELHFEFHSLVWYMIIVIIMSLLSQPFLSA